MGLCNATFVTDNKIKANYTRKFLSSSMFFFYLILLYGLNKCYLYMQVSFLTYFRWRAMPPILCVSS
jgi:hypothetical protein